MGPATLRRVVFSVSATGILPILAPQPTPRGAGEKIWGIRRFGFRDFGENSSGRGRGFDVAAGRFGRGSNHKPSPKCKGLRGPAGAQFSWRSAHTLADFGSTGGFATAPGEFRRFGNSDIGISAAIHSGGVCAGGRGSQLHEIAISDGAIGRFGEFRPQTASELRGSGQAGRGRGFGNDLPISGRPVDLR